MAEGTGMIGAGNRPEPYGMEMGHGQVEGETKNSRELRREIERTRAEMSQTIRSIRGRFSSGYLRDQAGKLTEQASGTVREVASARAEGAVHRAQRKARGFGTMVVDTVKAHPIPTALAFAAAAWLVYRLR